jgi:carbonic anhydrase
MRDRFGTIITCMDGRVQEPVREYLRGRYLEEYWDVVTEAGVDRVLALGPEKAAKAIWRKVCLSVTVHGSKRVVVVGHDDCAGNPVTREEHWEHIRKALDTVRKWMLPVQVIGLWVPEDGELEQVAARSDPKEIGAD